VSAAPQVVFPDWCLTGIQDSGILGDAIEAACGIALNERTDPVEFAEKVLGMHLWSKQREIARALQEHEKVSVRSAHGMGKTCFAAFWALYWLFTRTPSYVITTAPTFRQVKSLLWREIRKMWLSMPDSMKARGEAQETTIKMRVGVGPRSEFHPVHLAYGVSTDKEVNIQGEHKENMLVVFDEAAGIPDPIMDTIESWGADSLFAIGNPTIGAGWFFKSHQDPALGWHTIRVSAEDSPNWTGEDFLSADGQKSIADRLMKKSLAAHWARKHGENSVWYKSRVLAEFPDVDSRQIIAPQAWIDAAMNRKPDEQKRKDLLRIGVDVGESGTGRTCLCVQADSEILALYSYAGPTKTEECIALVHEVVREWAGGYDQVEVRIDRTGVGSGVASLMEARSTNFVKYIGVHFGEHAIDAKRFINWRAEAYWALREGFDPSVQTSKNIRFGPRADEQGAIEALAAQLTEIKWSVNSASRYQIESKKELQSRGIPSPDEADACVLAFAPLEQEVETEDMTWADDVLAEMGFEFEMYGLARDDGDRR
jgi:phage terminase large subunit